MKKLLISFILIFLSFNINAAISQSGITNLKQLDDKGIIELISGNQLTGYISDGPFQGPIVQTFYKNGKYESIFEDKIYRGVWKVENKRLCSKKNTASNFNCVYWYTGFKDGGTYAYIIAQGQIFHQYHELKSVIQVNQEKKKVADAKKKADAKKAEAKRKTAEAKRKAAEVKRIADAKKAEVKRIADAKKAEAKRKAAEVKRIADAKKAEAKRKAAEVKRIADAKKAEAKRKAAEVKRIADAKKAEEAKRIAEVELNKKLALIPPETELQKAQNFLSDIEGFVEKNPDEFDIMKIAMFKIKTKLISEGVSNDEQMNTIELFKEFVKTSSTFIKFEKKQKDARKQNKLKKISNVINSIDRRISSLKINQKKNLLSKSLLLINEKIKSSQYILNNPTSLSELQDVDKELFELLNDLKAEELKIIAAKKAEKEITQYLNSELLKIDQNINKLKTYLAENLSSMSPELMILLMKKVEVLEDNKKYNYFPDSKSEELKALKKLNEDISTFILDNNLLTTEDIAATKKQAEDKKKAAEAKRKADAKKAEAKRKADAKRKANAKEAERLKNFKTVNMNCSYSVGGQYLSYSWTYDGKKLYWEGIPINIGNNNIEQGMSINVRKLSSRDKFNIKINLTLWLYEFENDFYNKTSVIDFYGMKGFGSCY